MFLELDHTPFPLSWVYSFYSTYLDDFDLFLLYD